jgi:hypothetical protein
LPREKKKSTIIIKNLDEFITRSFVNTRARAKVSLKVALCLRYKRKENNFFEEIKCHDAVMMMEKLHSEARNR